MIVRTTAALALAAWVALGAVRGNEADAAAAPEPAAAATASVEPAEPKPPSIDPLHVVLDAEVARLENLLHSLEVRREAAESDLEQVQAEHNVGTEQIVSLADRMAAAGSGGPEVNALYVEIVSALQELRPRLARALDRWRARIEVPDVRIELDDAVRTTPSYAEREQSFDALEANIAAEAEAVRRAEQAARWAAVDLRAVRTDRLNALRVACLDNLGFSDRQRILSFFSKDGIAQLRREINQISLSLRVYAARREHRVNEIPERMKDIFRIGSVTWTVLKIIALVIVLAWARKRWTGWIEEGRQWLFRRVASVRGRRRVERLLGAVEVVGPWSFFLIALTVAKNLIGAIAEAPETELAYRIVFAYGAYRLGIDAAFALTVSAATRYRLSMDDARRKKLFESVRAVARLLAAIAILLSLSALLLGKGYLYHFIVRFAWIFGAVITVRLLGRWRQEIGEAYLKVQPRGALADAVRKARERWYGIFVAGASFAWLFGRGIAVLARDFALGFDQTRRALAFLFRKRIEKQAEQQGYAGDSLESLPATLIDAFRSDPVPEGDLVVDHFPEFASLESALAEWKAGRGGGAFLIHGEAGIGKTSWLHRVGADGVPKSALSFDERPGTAARLAESVSASLLSGGAVSSPAALTAALREGPQRIVTVDVAQNLFLSKVGGYEAFAAFVDLVSATSGHVFWVCSFNEFAWVHLSAVRPDLSVFRRQIRLPAWSEPQIRDLIRARLTASGVQASYEDLVVDKMEGVSAQATLLQTEEGYTRLLWDYAEGNPRVALHYRLRSVVPDSENRVRVRLFRAPDSATLERGGQEALFVLAAIVNHENLSEKEIVEVTRMPESICRIHVDRFRELGALTVSRGRCRVSTRWQRAAIRLLRRRNLLPD